MSILKQKVGGVAVERTPYANYDSFLVHTAGNESIAGIKTFDESPLVPTVANVSDNSMKAASTAFVQSAVTKIISVTGESGALTSEALALLKADKHAMIERAGTIYQYASTLSDGTMRYTVVSSFTGDSDYLCVISVDSTSGSWSYAYRPLVTKSVNDCSIADLTNPDGITDGRIWYRVKNNMVTVGCENIKASRASYYSFTGFPTMYLPVGRQVCATVTALNTNPGAVALLYVDLTTVKIRIHTINTDFWGSVSYMI